jgi:hypothetical protein
LKDDWFAREKKKTVLNVAADRSCRCKNVDAYETNAHYRRILVTPFRTNAGDVFDFLTLQTLTKLKTTFGQIYYSGCFNSSIKD